MTHLRPSDAQPPNGRPRDTRPLRSKPFDSGAFDAIYRAEVGRCTATMVRVLGDIDLAEDAVGEAFAIAA